MYVLPCWVTAFVFPVIGYAQLTFTMIMHYIIVRIKE